jgi:hypothetical protein
VKKAYFQYYETFEVILEKIKDSEEREHMRKTIINYGLYGTEPAGLSELEEMAWTICKDLIDQQYRRRETNAQNRAAKKAETATPEATAEVEPEPAQEPETKPEGTPEEKSKSQPEKRAKFVKPTVEEIAAYCKDKGYNINARQFFNYYESNGWKVGRNAMKSWQAAVQNWSTRDKTSGKAAGTMWANNSADADTSSYEDMF